MNECNKQESDHCEKGKGALLYIYLEERTGGVLSIKGEKNTYSNVSICTSQMRE